MDRTEHRDIRLAKEKVENYLGTARVKLLQFHWEHSRNPEPSKLVEVRARFETMRIDRETPITI
jgi:diketogulonate reductase-like aldo/keto reductase